MADKTVLVLGGGVGGIVAANAMRQRLSTEHRVVLVDKRGVWYEAQEEGERELRIQARHVLTGETRYFLAWPALMAYLSGKQDVIDPVPVQQIGRKAISC